MKNLIIHAVVFASISLFVGSFAQAQIGSRIEIQSAMLSDDNKSMNICIFPVPQEWLNRN